nr:MarR family winged helix-turn-helix transcriptional regulator [uncultured Clostridium sp.]
MKTKIEESIKYFYDTYLGIDALYDKWAKIHGLTSNSLFVLYMLHEYPNQCTQRFICEKLYYPKQTVNAIFNTFIQQGYVEKVISKDNKRNKIVSFTEAGQKYADELLNKLHLFEGEALLNMGEDERNAMLKTNFTFTNN